MVIACAVGCLWGFWWLDVLDWWVCCWVLGAGGCCARFGWVDLLVVCGLVWYRCLGWVWLFWPMGWVFGWCCSLCCGLFVGGFVGGLVADCVLVCYGVGLAGFVWFVRGWYDIDVWAGSGCSRCCAGVWWWVLFAVWAVCKDVVLGGRW